MSVFDAALSEAFPGDEEPVENVEEVEPEAPVEEPAETEEETPETEEAPEEEPAQYDPESIAKLEKRLADQESFIGRQKNEIGELRALKEQFDALQQQVQQQPQPSPFAEPTAWDNVNFDNPATARQAALWVYQNRPYEADAFMETWYENSPRAATSFEIELAKYELQDTVEEKFAPVKDIPQDLERERTAAATQVAFQNVWDTLKSQNPDLDEYAKGIIETASKTKALVPVFEGTDEEAMTEVLGTLLENARYRRYLAQQEADAQTADAAVAAKSKARVTSATSTAGTRAVQKPQTRMGGLLEEAFGDLNP